MNRAVRKPQKRNKHTPDKRPRWVRRELELLGRQSDREVAALLGRSGRAVESKRFRLRISARSTHYPRQLSPEEIGRLRSLSDREVERLLRRTPIFPRRAITPPGQRVRQLWFAHEDALLGTRPDRVVAVCRTHQAFHPEASPLLWLRPAPSRWQRTPGFGHRNAILWGNRPGRGCCPQTRLLHKSRRLSTPSVRDSQA